MAALSMPTYSFATPQPLVYTRQGVSFNQLAAECGRDVHPDTLQAVARVESRFNPYAIGVVRGALKRQPKTYEQAVAAAKMLHAQGRNFSMGLMQVNRYNLKAYGWTTKPCFIPARTFRRARQFWPIVSNVREDARRNTCKKRLAVITAVTSAPAFGRTSKASLRMSSKFCTRRGTIR